MKRIMNGYTEDWLDIVNEKVGAGRIKVYGKDGLSLIRYGVGKVKRSLAIFQLVGDKNTFLGKVGRDDALGIGQGMAKAWCMEALKYVHQDIVDSGLTEEDYLAKSSIKL